MEAKAARETDQWSHALSVAVRIYALPALPALDAPVTRVVRALTFRRLYHCRNCDALFEAILVSGKRNGSNAGLRKEKRRKSPASFDSRVEPLESPGGN